MKGPLEFYQMIKLVFSKRCLMKALIVAAIIEIFKVLWQAFKMQSKLAPLVIEIMLERKTVPYNVPVITVP